jgi:hypothetical protein
MLIEHKVEMEMLKELKQVIETKLDALAEMTIVYEEERCALSERESKLNIRMRQLELSNNKPF